MQQKRVETLLKYLSNDICDIVVGYTVLEIFTNNQHTFLPETGKKCVYP